MTSRDEEKRSVLARVRVVDPVPGCAYALQHRDGTLDHIQLAADDALAFTASITLKVRDDDTFDPTGNHVNGPRGRRFLYVCSGTLAGQADSPWTRRAKVSLDGLAEVVPLSVDLMPPLIEVVIAGRARDGGPACASVVPEAPWRLYAELI